MPMNMLQQFDCHDNKFLSHDKTIALKHKNYVATQNFDVVTQNFESYSLIVVTKISMSQQIYDSKS